MNRNIGISVGDPISYEEILNLGKNDELLHNLQKITWELQNDPYYGAFKTRRGALKMLKKKE
jgi:flagellar biosynthesis regulator FlbT